MKLADKYHKHVNKWEEIGIYFRIGVRMQGFLRKRRNQDGRHFLRETSSSRRHQLYGYDEIKYVQSQTRIVC